MKIKCRDHGSFAIRGHVSFYYWHIINIDENIEFYAVRRHCFATIPTIFVMQYHTSWSVNELLVQLQGFIMSSFIYVVNSTLMLSNKLRFNILGVILWFSILATFARDPATILTLIGSFFNNLERNFPKIFLSDYLNDIRNCIVKFYNIDILVSLSVASLFNKRWKENVILF